MTDLKRGRRVVVVVVFALVVALVPLTAGAELDCVADAVPDDGSEVLDVQQVCLDLDAASDSLGVRITTGRPPTVADVPEFPINLLGLDAGSIDVQRTAADTVIAGVAGSFGEDLECVTPVELTPDGMATDLDLACIGSASANLRTPGCAQVVYLAPFGDLVLDARFGVDLGDWSFGTIDPAGRADESDAVPDPDPSLVGAATVDGDPRTTESVAQGAPAFSAIVLSRQRFRGPEESRCGGTAPSHVVLARNDQFADALTAGPLLRTGPLLFSAPDEIGPVTLRELQRLGGGVVAYVLGGEAALSPRVVEQLTGLGYVVQRLAGPTRVETAIAVAEGTRPVIPGECVEDPQTGIPECTEPQPAPYLRISLARADAPADNPTAAWADAVTAGGAGTAILLTQSDALHPAVADFLVREGTEETVLYGGPSALSAAVEVSVPRPRRVAGADRAATAVAIARDRGLLEPGLRTVAVFNGYSEDGWAFGLAASGLDLPLLMVEHDRLPEATAAALSTCGPAQVDVLVVGDATLVGPTVLAELDALDGGAC